MYSEGVPKHSPQGCQGQVTFKGRVYRRIYTPQGCQGQASRQAASIASHGGCKAKCIPKVFRNTHLQAAGAVPAPTQPATHAQPTQPAASQHSQPIRGWQAEMYSEGVPKLCAPRLSGPSHPTAPFHMFFTIHYFVLRPFCCRRVEIHTKRSLRKMTSSIYGSVHLMFNV